MKGNADILAHSCREALIIRFKISLLALILGISSTAWSLSAQQQALNTFIACVQFVTTKASLCQSGGSVTCEISATGQLVGAPGTPGAYFSYSIANTCRSPFGVQTCGGNCPLSDGAIAVPPSGVTNSGSTVGDISAVTPAQRACGSVINKSNRSVGEAIPVAGTSFSLSYQTLFDPDRLANREVVFNFTPDPADPGYGKTISVHGAYTPLTVIPLTSLDYLWSPGEAKNPFVDSDNLDISLVSTLSLQVQANNGTLGLTSPAAPDATTGANLSGSTVTATINQGEPALEFNQPVAVYKPKVWGLGGWTLSNHHYYDSLTGTLFLGQGIVQRIVLPQVNDPTYGTVYMGAALDGSEVYYFDQQGRHLETKTPLLGATKWKFLYLPNNQLDQIVDGNGLVTKILRDSSGNIQGIQAPFGQTTQLAVNSIGKLANIQDPSGANHTVSYGPSGLISEIDYPSGLITQFTHDDRGQFLREDKNTGGFQTLLVQFGNSIKSFIFTTAAGVVDTVTDASGSNSETELETDSAGNQLSSIQRSLNKTSVNTVTPFGNEQATLQPDVRFGSLVMIPQSVSDLFGPDTAVRDFQTTSQSVTYSSGNGPFKVASLQTSTTDSWFSSLTQVTSFSSSDNSLTLTMNGTLASKVFIDQLERPTRIQTPGALDTLLNYNSLGQLTTLSQGQSNYQFVYDSAGNLSQKIDPLNRVTSYLRDANGRVTLTTLPNGDQISYSYSAAGDLIKLTTPHGDVHEFTPTLLGQIGTYLAPLVAQGSSSTQYGFDADGRLASITKANGEVATLSYKPGTNYLQQITTPEGNYLFQNIDSVGRVGTMVSPDGITTTLLWTNTDTDFESNAESTGANFTTSLRIAFDQFFRPTSINSDAITYDSLGRVATVGSETFTYQTSNQSSGSGNIATSQAMSSLTAAGNILSTTMTTTTSDSLILNPTSRQIMMVGTLATGTRTVETMESVDVVGNITQSARSTLLGPGGSTETDQTVGVYQYDLNNRLTEVDESEYHNLQGTISVVASRPIAKYSFPAGSNGNVGLYSHYGNDTVATYDAQDRLVGLSGAITRNYSYTLDGMVAGVSNCLGTKSNQYDFFGNLKSVTLPDGTVISYKLDGFNRRVAKFKNGNLIEHYKWLDQTHLGDVFNDDGTRSSVHYVYGAHPIAPSYAVIAGTFYKIIPTWKGDIRYLVAPDGTIAQEIVYDEYGVVLIDTSIGRKDSFGFVKNFPLQPLGFVSGLTDYDTKLVHFSAREYDPTIGRWMSKDPLGFGGGDTNLYEYASKNPVNYRDPRGTDTNGVGVSLSGALMGAAVSVDAQVVADDKGHFGLAITVCGGGASQVASVNLGTVVSNTNASSVDQLNGPSASVGAAGGAPLPVSFSFQLSGSQSNSAPNCPKGVTGKSLTTSVSAGRVPAEVSGMGCTTTVYHPPGLN
ncbi:MAG: hypothetical protein C5B49_08020 [Bdellovibrio sp.]|nr:MAG: hypothetical protein C5B49_08020 [Bdellovibrio sp.]